MPTDNSIYEALPDWWDPAGSVAGIHAMNPARFGYFRRVLEEELGRKLDGMRLLDVGAGGGLLTEPFLAAGARAVGIDRATGALGAALGHARQTGLEARYAAADALSLPFGDATFDAVTACDFLEHVKDRVAVLRECARVLVPGGVLLFDTINRTWLTRVFHIGVLQEWRKLVPKDTHAYPDFVRPDELASDLAQAGLLPVEMRGLLPERPVRFALHLMTRSPGDKGPMPPFRIGRWMAGSYVGWARVRARPR